MRVRGKLYRVKHAAAFMLLVLTSACGSQQHDGAAAAIPDGNWRIVAIDDRPVTNPRMMIAIRDNAITGGHDGCNAWGFEEHEGQRMIVSNAMACPGDAESASYDLLQNTAPGSVRLSLDNSRVVARAGGHRFTAMR
jgi:heat shock protein HslJ